MTFGLGVYIFLNVGALWGCGHCYSHWHASLQGKRVACEDGSEGYSDLYQENAMLQRENDTLRLRVKAMQETIDHLNTRVTHLLANEVSNLLSKSST